MNPLTNSQIADYRLRVFNTRRSRDNPKIIVINTDNLASLLDEVEASRENIRQLIEQRSRVYNFVMNNLEEVKNQGGGVIGYRLLLNADDTEKLLKQLEARS